MQVSSPDNDTPIAAQAAPDVNTAPESSTGSDVKPASEPSVDAPKGEKSILDVVRTTLIKDTEKSPGSGENGSEDPAKPNTEQPGAETAKAEALEGDPDETELKRYSQNAQSRIRKTISDRDGFKRNLEEAKPKIEGFEAVLDYAKRNNLQSEDMDRGFAITAALKNDPAKALELLEPVYQQLLGTMGRKLPEDVQRDVNLGYISEERAKELAQARAGQTLAEKKATEQREAGERQQAEQRQQKLVGDVQTTVTEWEESQAKSDPDWTQKRDRIKELVELEVLRKGFPESPKAALEMVQRHSKKVSDDRKALLPKPRTINPPVDAASTRSKAQPQTLLDVVRQTLGH